MPRALAAACRREHVCSIGPVLELTELAPSLSAACFSPSSLSGLGQVLAAFWSQAFRDGIWPGSLCGSRFLVQKIVKWVNYSGNYWHHGEFGFQVLINA